MQLQYLSSALLLVFISFGAARGHSMRGTDSSQGLAVEAPAAAGDESPELHTTSMDWEIENMNYYDLTNTWQDPFANGDMKTMNDLTKEMDHDSPRKALRNLNRQGASHTKKATKSIAGSPKAVDDGLNNGIDNMRGGGTTADKGSIKKTSKASDDDSGGLLGSLGNVGKLPWPTTAALLLVRNQALASPPPAQSGKVTIQKALRTAIEDAVNHVLNAPAGPGPAPAPAAWIPPPPPAGMLPPPVNPAALAQMPVGPAPAPGPAAATPKLHVAFAPGGKMKKHHVNHMINKPPLHAPVPQSVEVKVTVFDMPNNGVDDMKLAMAELKKSWANGQLHSIMDQAIQRVTGVAPRISGMKFKSAVVKAWDIPKCEGHMSKILKLFGAAYSRRQVPMALYNECTNYMTKISFSHDYVLDHRDEVRCRKATRSFARKWKLSKKNDPKKFEGMCVNFCEAKYGNDAPLCHITAGEMLASQPI